MKKLIVFLILFSAIYSSAQNYKYIRLENAKYALGKTLGDDLNDLLRQGYSVRKMSATNDGYKHYLCAILSDDDQGATIESYVYVVLSRYESKYYLSGEIPSGLKKEYSSTVIDQNNLLQELSNNGFQLDFFDIDGKNDYYLFSKRKSGGGSHVRNITYDNGAIEMARYNMKGMPVDKNYKGIQIIVYSNYTTKVVNIN